MSRMEFFLRDRDLACQQLEPHSAMWEVCNNERYLMAGYIVVWELLRARGDASCYNAQDRFLEKSHCLRVLCRERRYRDPREAGA